MGEWENNAMLGRTRVSALLAHVRADPRVRPDNPRRCWKPQPNRLRRRSRSRLLPGSRPGGHKGPPQRQIVSLYIGGNMFLAL